MDEVEHFKQRYETLIGESWEELETRVRSNPNNQWIFEIVDRKTP